MSILDKKLRFLLLVSLMHFEALLSEVSALCYDKLKFPMTTQVSFDTTQSAFFAITGDSDYLYSGGYSNSQGFNLYNGSAQKRPVIVKIDQATRSYSWRHFYVDSNNEMTEVTALALRLSTADNHLAVVASDPLQTLSFVFAVDTLSGDLVSSPFKI